MREPGGCPKLYKFGHLTMGLPKKVVRVMCAHNNAYEIFTTMPGEGIAAELENRPLGDYTPDPTWVRIEGFNDLDEHTPVAILREDVRGYIIVPFHPSQAQRPPVGPPRIVQ